MSIVLIKSILIGIGASIPLGPVGVLCVQRTINSGRFSGFISGLGAATADTLFAFLAIFSLSFVQRFMEDNESILFVVGGIILVILGASIFSTNPIKQIRRNNKQKEKHVKNYMYTLILTLSNPGAIFLLLGLFTFMQVEVTSESGASIAMVLWGVFIGAAFWWFTLTALINFFRQKFRLRQLVIINRIMGFVIFVLGIISVINGVFLYLKTIL